MNRCKRMIWFMLLICITCIVGVKQEVCAAGYVKIDMTQKNTVKTYSTYDVTGDGKWDTMKWIVISDENGDTLQITVNDEVVYAYTNEDCNGWKLGLIRLDNGKTVFDISSMSSNDYVVIHKLFEYSNESLKVIYDMQKAGARYAYRYDETVDKVKGNMIYVNASGQFYTTGKLNYKMRLKYAGGKIKRMSNSASCTGYDPFAYHKFYGDHKKWTVNKKIKVYKQIGKKKTAYTLKNGNIITITKIIFDGKKVWFQVKNQKGKKGYIPAAKKHPKKDYFKEAFFVG